MTLDELLQLLVGPAGRYLRGLWEPHEVLSNLLWSANIPIRRTAAVRIINGQRSLPVKCTKPYRVDGGLAILEEDLCAFMAHYHSTAMVRDIYIRINMAVVESDWSPEQIAALDEYHIVNASSRDQIASYIARVMYAIICA